MASFLFAATPAAGHVAPALPIVRQLVDAGHEVRFTTGSAFEPAVTAAGARFLPLPADASIDAARLDELFPGREKLTGPRLIRHDLLHVFTAPVAAQATHLLALLAAEPADTLVADTGFVGAGPAAEASGVPLGGYGISVFPYRSRDVSPFGSALPPPTGWPTRLRAKALGGLLDRLIAGPTRASLDRQRRELGLPPRGRTVLAWPDVVGLYLQLSPAGFDYPRSDLPPVVHRVGMPVPAPPPGWVPPAWWDEPSDRPLIVVTQGTVATDPDELLRPALAGLAGEPVRVVALTGGAPADTIALVPPNARVAEWLPYGPLFRRASAVVTNGGFGGVQIALGHGLPLVVAGRTEDKPEVCARVAWSGVGIDLRSRRPSPAAVRDAVREVLGTPAYASRAGALAATAPPGEAAGRAAELLVELAVTGRPVLAVTCPA